MTEINKTDVKEFIKFYKRLEEAGVNPELYEADTEKRPVYDKSTLEKSSALTFDGAKEILRAGRNVLVFGHAKNTGKSLVILDIDVDKSTGESPIPEDKLQELLDLTGLVTRSRNGGYHLYFLMSPDPEIKSKIWYHKGKNCGEMRHHNSYVVAPGSYVESDNPVGTGLYHLYKEGIPQNLVGLPDWIEFNKGRQSNPKTIDDSDLVTYNLKTLETVLNEDTHKRLDSIIEHNRVERERNAALDESRQRPEEDLDLYEEKAKNLNDLLSGPDAVGYESRSEADAAAYRFLYLEGFDYDRIVKILRTYRNYEKTQRDDYCELLKQYDFVEWDESDFIKMVKLYGTKPGNHYYNWIWIEKMLIRRFHIKTPRETQVLHLYKDGHYTPRIEPDKIYEIITKIGFAPVTKSFKKDLASDIGYRTQCDEKEFNQDPAVICCANCLLNVETDEVIPFSPWTHIKPYIPVIYDPEIKCPVVSKFLSEVLPEWSLKTVLQIIGYCCIYDYSIKKIIYIAGVQDTGKTTFLNLLINFVGEENTESISPQLLTGSHFGTAELYGKTANISDDISSQRIKDTDFLKSSSGGGWLNSQVKFRSAVRFQNKATHVFGMNQLPSIPNDDAFTSRLLMLVFDSIIKHKDRTLGDKLQSHTELSGLLNLVLPELKELLRNYSFDGADQGSITTDEYRNMSKPHLEFVKEEIGYQQDGFVPTEKILNSLDRWVEENHVSVHVNQTLTREVFEEIMRLGRDVLSVRKKVKGKLMRGVTNVCLTNEIDEETGVPKPSEQSRL